MKRGRPLARKTPLVRKSRLRSRSATSSYRRRPRDLDYMTLVRKLPCVVRQWTDAIIQGLARGIHQLPPPTPCYGRVQADHAGSRALGRKAPDDTCIPMCEQHHEERTDYKRTFRGFSKDEMRAWNDWAIQKTRGDVDELRRLAVGVFAEQSTVCGEPVEDTDG